MKIFLSFIFSLSLLSIVAQEDSVQSIMMRGIDYHENGQYDLSLIEYQKALNLEPKNAFVNYEVALSHYYMGNKTRAEKFAKVASKEASENGLQAMVLLGAIYDERGEHKKSIKTYREGLKTFGDYYLIWYNLGVTANTIKDFELAEEAFLNSINNKLDNASSHYAMASIMMQQNRRVEAIYPLYFFLMLESDSDRSEMAYTDILNLMQRGVQTSRDEEGKMVIQLQVLNPENQEDMMGSGDFYLSMLQAAATTSEGEEKTPFQIFSDNSHDFFEYMARQDAGDREDFYTTYYIPLFNEIAQSKHFETFMHYISQSAYPENKTWVMSHTKELGEFFDWLDLLDLE
jgi:tetratricopeptide (TPR) repeat protein